MNTNCRHCGKILRRWKYGADMPQAMSLDVLRQVKTGDDQLPRLGYQGNNVFCSLRCGFDWAIARVR